MAAAADLPARDEAVAAFRSCGELATTLAGGWFRPVGDDTVIAVTGYPTVTANGIMALSHTADPATLAPLLDELAGLGLPFNVAAPTEAADGLDPLLRRSGLVRAPAEPVLRCDDLRAGGQDVEQGDVRAATVADLEAMPALIAEVFECPASAIEPLFEPAFRDHPSTIYVVAEVDGELTAAATGTCSGASVGVFSVATLPRFRRRGLGSAVTAAVMHAAADAGCSWAWLMSSPVGLHVYERLGFRVVDSMTAWSWQPPG